MILINTKTGKKKDIYKKNGNPNFTKAAEIIGVDRKTIYNWREQGQEYEDYHFWRLYFE